MRDRRRCYCAQGFDKTSIGLTTTPVRHRERWTDRDPDLGTRRSGQPTARSIQPIRAEDDRRNDRNAGDSSEGGRATLRCSATKNGRGASADTALGKDSHGSPGTQVLDPDTESTPVWSRTVHGNGIKRTKPRPDERIGVKLLS